MSMNRLKALFNNAGVVARLLFWFLVISLVPCVLLTVVTSYLSRRALEHSVRDRLWLIAEDKMSLIENFAAERRGDVLVLGSAPGIVSAVVELHEALKTKPADSAEYRRLADRHRPYLTRFVGIYGYNNLHIFDVDGNLLVSHAPFMEPGENVLTGSFRGTEFSNVFERTRHLLQPVLSNYQLYPGRKEASAFMAGPIVQDGLNVGIVIFEFGNDQVFRVFTDYGGLGATGETIVAMRNGDELTFVSPSRFDTTTAFRRKLRLGDKVGIPMQRASVGQRGIGTTIDYRGEEVISVWSYVPAFRWGLVIKQDRHEAFELLYHQRLATAILFLASGLAVILVALLVARSLSRPIQEAARVAKSVAAGDLSQHVAMTAAGEPGQLLNAVRTMTQDLRSLIGKIQKSSISLMSTATEIAATARQQEQTVVDYGASTNEAAAAVQEISATGQELLKTMNEVNTVAGQTAEMASTGQQDLGGMDRTMRVLADSTSSISSKLAVISERAANINLVVTTITKVADQTNLLSINAAIEAEKAGEYGLGFLVVAREIRRLADQTAVATLDIERMVKEMQSSVAAGVMEMDQFSDKVRHGVEEVGNISDQLGQIIHAVQSLTERFEQVTEGMRVQALGADQIREAVVRINDGANQTSISLREFNKATTYLREAVGILKEEVSRFSLGESEPQVTGPRNG
jgi:methyl-accepting chemotaxis protein WspA